MSRSHSRRHDVPILYKYASPETARSILAGNCLRWSSPELFNDPFDVRRDLELPFTNEELLEALLDRFRAYFRGEAEPGSSSARKLLAGFLQARKHAPEEVLLASLRITLATFMIGPVEKARNEFRDAWTDRVPGMRILCMSRDPSSPSMWAHYAANLTGAVLGFESSDERDSTLLLAQPVQYLDRRPTLPAASEWVRTFLGEHEIDWEKYLSEYYFVKSTHWSYEQEYRVASDKRKGETGLFSDYRFFEEDLREVILGPRADSDFEHHVRVAVQTLYRSARITRARLDTAARRVVADFGDAAAT